MSYRTFIRSATSFYELNTARKITQETGLSQEEALQRCEEYNSNRTTRQVRNGTKMEFTKE